MTYQLYKTLPALLPTIHRTVHLSYGLSYLHMKLKCSKLQRRQKERDTHCCQFIEAGKQFIQQLYELLGTTG